MPKEKPILFSTEMVQAILDGRKTETRRVFKYPKWAYEDSFEGDTTGEKGTSEKPLVLCKDTGCFAPVNSPYGYPGDLLYVRETWASILQGGDMAVNEVNESCVYKASVNDPDEYTWRPSIHLRKKHSRIWIRVKEIKVERVQDITIDGIKAEGVQIPVHDGKPLIPLTDKYFPHGIIDIENPSKENLYHAFWVQLWDSINADRGYSYESNPWIWCVKFEVVSTDGRPG